MSALHASDVWVIGGIGLLIGEMLTGGFFLMFLALGAFAASTAAAFGQPFAVQLLVGAGISVVGTLVLRKPLQKRLLKSAAGLRTDIGKEITIDQAVPAHKSARITYQGTQWEASNLGSEDIRNGDRIVIVGIDGISLLIRKVN